MQNKLYKLVFIFIMFSLVIPFYSYASDVTYVWSEISSPIISTSSVLSQGKR